MLVVDDVLDVLAMLEARAHAETWPVRSSISNGEGAFDARLVAITTGAKVAVEAGAGPCSIRMGALAHQA